MGVLTMTYIYTALFLIIFMTIWYDIARIKNNLGLVDLAWGLTFVVITWSQYYLNKPTSWIPLIIAFFVTIWGGRLFIHLAIRNWNKPEDFRYTNMRQRWTSAPWLTAFIKVFLFQGFLAFIIALPLQVSMMMQYEETLFTYVLFGIGALFFIFGFIFESVSDAQLKAFKNNPKNKGNVMTSGLWSLTRHPNYFGDFLVWWGFFFIAISSLDFLMLWIIVGPLIMSYLLRFVSGVPLLEKRYADNEAYQAYASKTPIFFPSLKNKKTS